MQSEQSLPPCPNCNGTSFETVRGGDSVEDPYPDQQPRVYRDQRPELEVGPPSLGAG